MVKLAILSLFLAATNAVIIRDNYDVVTKYNCWKDGEIFLDRGLVFRFEEVFLNNWPGNSAFNCHMPISNRYKSPGIISVIQHLKFRETGDSCIDYIQLNYNQRNDHHVRYCGEMVMGQILLNNGATWNPPKFISEFAVTGDWFDRNKAVSHGVSLYHSSAAGIFIHVDDEPLKPGERLAFVVSFTGFVECDGLNVPKGLFNCGYGVCILEMFVGDGIVNCPFGDCRDEGNCYEALEDIDVLTNGSYSGDSMTSNSTITPMMSRPFLQWLGNNRGRTGPSTERIEQKVVQELGHIKEEMKKNTGYLERIIQMLAGNFSSQIKNMTEY